jgi:hypothetical protein
MYYMVLQLKIGGFTVEKGTLIDFKGYQYVLLIKKNWLLIKFYIFVITIF